MNDVVSLLLNTGVCILLLRYTISPECIFRVQNLPREKESRWARTHTHYTLEAWKSYRHTSEFIGSSAGARRPTQVHSKEITIRLIYKWTNAPGCISALFFAVQFDATAFYCPEGFLVLCITLLLNLSEQRQSGRYFSFLALATNSFPILFIVCSLFSWRRRRRFNKAAGAPEKEERRPYLAFLNFNPTAIPATSSHIYLSTLFRLISLPGLRGV